MFYKNPDEIFNIMSETITNVDKSENSLVYNTQYPVALEFANTRLDMDEMLKKCFATTAYYAGYSYYLDLRVNEVGLTRKLATKAKIPCHITGRPNRILPSGSMVSTIDNRLYFTDKDYTLDENGEADIIVVAEKYGSTYNVKANEITIFPTSYAGINTITNPNEYNSAYDEETDEDLYNRYLLHIRKIITSANKNQYEEWCLSIEGVGSCKVIPLWNGNGTVKCVITNSNKRKASQELINTVKEKIDPNNGDGVGLAPIGAYLTVTTVEEITVDIEAKIELEKGSTMEDVKSDMEKQFTIYFDSDVFKTRKVKLSKIANIIGDTVGISDVDIDTIKINNTNKNLKITDEQIVVIGNINLMEI